MVNRRKLVAALGAGTVLFWTSIATAGAAEKVTVFAAASLKNALDDVSAAWKAEAQKETNNTYAASSALAKQIESGAPADVFLSADLDWMKYLTDRKLIMDGTQINLLGNEIVLVAPKDSTAATTIEKNFALADLLGDGKLVMADVKAVPAGKYGKAALESLGVWSAVEGKVAQTENVRAALKLVATGEAPLGIVYRTDVMAEPAVKIVGTFPADSHPPIVYPVAVMAQSKHPDAKAFVTYMQSEKAQEIFKEHGFSVLVPVASQ